MKKLILLLGIVCVSSKAFASGPSDRLLSMVFGVPGNKLEGFSAIEASYVNSANSKSESRYVFFKFSTSVDNFEKFLVTLPMKTQKIDENLISLDESFRNDLSVFPAWFNKVKQAPSRTYSSCWKPYLERAGEKSFFGFFEIRVDSYNNPDGSVIFYGICTAEYQDQPCEQVKVNERDFAENGYLGLNDSPEK